MTEIETLAGWLDASESNVALTGAGVSTDSGIPDFRSANAGIWRDHDPMEVASLGGFNADPRRFYAFWGHRFQALDEAPPNATHTLLARLEAAGQLDCIVTQNIDGLHQRAGSKTVHEVHGAYRQARCLACERVETLDAVTERILGGRLPICQVCGGFVKPDVVLFGEQLPEAFAHATRAVKAAGVLLVLGSSLGVHPVAGLVPDAANAGAKVVLVNREATPYDDIASLVIHTELVPFSEALSARMLSR